MEQAERSRSSRVIFPMCGLTYADMVDAACTTPNMRACAKRLGVSGRQLYEVAKRIGASHWFGKLKPRPSKVNIEEVVELAQQGFIRADVAYMIGISHKYLDEIVQDYGLADKFIVREHKAMWVNRRGYVGRD
jgi:hypothetical protein